MEEWRDIDGYVGLYQVSNLGRIRSIGRTVRIGKNGGKRVVENKILKSTDNGGGYKIIGLRFCNTRKNFYIHRLVAMAFVPNPNKCGYVNHKDYDTTNNAADNLEWCTQKENVIYSVERMKKPRKAARSNTGQKYIYLRNGRYRVCVPNTKEKAFRSLEDALRFREVMQSER